MILTLQEAQQIDASITQDALDSYEYAIRQVTHNNFQIPSARGWGITISGSTATLDRDNLTSSLQVGDTVEFNVTKGVYDSDNDYLLDQFEFGHNLRIGYGRVNDGLYTVTAKSGNTVTLDRAPRLADHFPNATLTRVFYPPDIKAGVRKLIAYDKNMAGKIGIKAEDISRMKVTYYDTNSAEQVNGYPAILMGFAKKYTKMYWGN